MFGMVSRCVIKFICWIVMRKLTFSQLNFSLLSRYYNKKILKINYKISRYLLLQPRYYNDDCLINCNNSLQQQDFKNLHYSPNAKK